MVYKGGGLVACGGAGAVQFAEEDSCMTKAIVFWCWGCL